MRKNMLTMAGRIEECVMFMYRCPESQVRPLVPDSLELVTYGGYAFIGIVVSRLAGMRPWPLPSWTGIGYRHIAYRVYVQYTPLGGAPMQGLYFLRSDANNRLMKAAGNVLTDFRFHHAEIEAEKAEDAIRIRISDSEDEIGNAEAVLRTDQPAKLPEHSCFASLREAMDFLHYEPYGIFVDEERKKVNVVKVVRDDRRWKEAAVFVESGRWTYMDHILPGQHSLELAVSVDSIDYRWERGVEYDFFDRKANYI